MTLETQAADRVDAQWERQDALTATITKIVPLGRHNRYTVTVDGGREPSHAFSRADAGVVAHQAIRAHEGVGPDATQSGTVRALWSPTRRRWTFTFDVYGWTVL